MQLVRGLRKSRELHFCVTSKSFWRFSTITSMCFTNHYNDQSIIITSFLSNHEIAFFPHKSTRPSITDLASHQIPSDPRFSTRPGNTYFLGEGWIRKEKKNENFLEGGVNLERRWIWSVWTYHDLVLPSCVYDKNTYTCMNTLIHNRLCPTPGLAGAQVCWVRMQSCVLPAWGSFRERGWTWE